MASTITVPSTDIVTEAKVTTAFTAAAVDIAALQLGTTMVGSTVAAGANLAITSAHNRKTVLLDTAAGSAVTLPAATGSGTRVRFLVTVPTTSAGAVTIACDATGNFVGTVFGARVDSGNAVLGFPAAANSNLLTMDHAAKGGVTAGEWLEIEDFAADKWSIRGQVTATGAAFGTPFSHV